MAALTRGIVAALFAVVTGGTDLEHKSGASLRDKAAPSRHSLIQKQPEVESQLVVCNAYASPKSLDVYHVQRLNLLTGGAPLKYKECREFTLPLAEGDQLDFKADSLDVGTFYATGLPKTSAKLLLIPHRRNNQAVGISFESHAFTDLQSAQIVVVDAYKGKGEGTVKISDVPAEGDKAEPVEEMLKFSSVVAVNPGKYKVALDSLGADKKPVKSPQLGKPLLVQDQAKCVVMRVGSDSTSNGKQHYPQELVVFPESNSLGRSLGLIALLLCIFATVFHDYF